MIEEQITNTHIIVNSNDLKKISNLIKDKLIKRCSQSFYLKVIELLNIRNAQKVMFLIQRKPIVLEQYWLEINDNTGLKEEYNKILKEISKEYLENRTFLDNLVHISELSLNGKVYLSLEDAKQYNILKKLASDYNHDVIQDINIKIFNEIVKLVINLV